MTKLETELLAALRGMFKAAEEIAVEYIEHKRAANWQIINDAYCNATAAIKRAEGNSAPKAISRRRMDRTR